MRTMFEIGDHPVVANMMRTGFPDGREPKEMSCPICGADAERFYETKDSIIVGCECCLTSRYYYEYETEGY